MGPQENILNTDIQGMDVDPGFKNGCLIMGFNTLEDILGLTIKEMMEKEGFSFRWLNTLISLLDDLGLMNRL